MGADRTKELCGVTIYFKHEDLKYVKSMTIYDCSIIFLTDRGNMKTIFRTSYVSIGRRSMTGCNARINLRLKVTYDGSKSILMKRLYLELQI